MDSLNILPSVKLLPDQCRQVIKELPQIIFPQDFQTVKNIVVSGMGGSALGGRVVKELERQILKLPIIISTEYHLPNFVDHNSLVIVSSYSGNTEETISSLAEARARNSKIFVLSTGGKLSEIATTNNIPHYTFDPIHNPSSQPRMGLGYGIMTIIMILEQCHLINHLPNLTYLADYLSDHQKNSESYYKIATVIKNHVPVLIGSEHLKGSTYCIRNQINETSKNMSVLFDIPELNHHLMEGLRYPDLNKNVFHFLLFNSSYYHPEVARRYPLTEEVLKKQGFSFTEINFSGPSVLFEAMDLIQIGGFVSFYLSQLNEIDPGPIPWVDYFKDKMKNKI